MSATSDQLLAAASVLAIVIGIMVYNMLAAARKPTAATAQTGEASASVAAPKTLVGRYLQHEGDVVGQVVAIDGEAVIVQKGAHHWAIPKTQVREQGLDLGLVGTVDAAAFEAAGALWKAGQAGP